MTAWEWGSVSSSAGIYRLCDPLHFLLPLVGGNPALLTVERGTPNERG